MLRLAVLAVALAGCDMVFGLADLRPPPDAADAPPEQLRVTGTYRQRYLTNNAAFTPLVNERIYAPGTISFSATLDDGTVATVDYSGDGTFSFPIVRQGQSYRFVTVADGVRSEIQTNTAQLMIGSMVAGRPERLTSNVSFVQFPFPPMGTTPSGAYLSSTGTYTYSYTGQFGPNVNFDWRLASLAPAGLPGFLEANKHDRIYALEMLIDTSLPGMPWTTIRAVSQASINQSPNSIATLPMPQVVPRDSCVRFSSANVEEHARLVAAAPRAYQDSASDWVVHASPAPDRLGLVGSIWVAICSNIPVRDYVLAPGFHVPYPGTEMLVQSSAVARFNIQLPTAGPLLLANASARYALAERANASACTPEQTVLTSTVALPGEYKLDNMPLDSDGKVVALDRTREIPFTWALTPGRVESFTVSLQELVIVNGTTANIPRRTIGVANQTSVMFDPNLFVPGNKYIIVVTSSRARPNVAQGDWMTVALPFENSSIWSRWFEVATR